MNARKFGAVLGIWLHPATKVAAQASELGGLGMTRGGKFVLVSALAGCALCASGSDPYRFARARNPFPTPASRVVLQPCKVPNLQEEVRCGAYEVYEDRSAKSGRKIALNIIVVPLSAPIPLPIRFSGLKAGPAPMQQDRRLSQGSLCRKSTRTATWFLSTSVAPANRTR
jgi:hypothetical protein